MSIYCSSSGGAFPQCLILNGWPSLRLRQGTEPASDARSFTTAPRLHHRGHHVLQPNPRLSALSFVPWHFSHTVYSCVTSFLLFFFSSSYILIPSLYFCRFPFLFFHQHRLEKLWWPQGTRRQSRSRELDRPWRIWGLGRPWRIRGLERSWRSSEHGQQWRVLRRYRGPSPRLGLYGRTPTTPPKYSLDKVDA